MRRSPVEPAVGCFVDELRGDQVLEITGQDLITKVNGRSRASIDGKLVEDTKRGEEIGIVGLFSSVFSVAEDIAESVILGTFDSTNCLDWI